MNGKYQLAREDIRAIEKILCDGHRVQIRPVKDGIKIYKVQLERSCHLPKERDKE